MRLPVLRRVFPGMATGIDRMPLTGIPYNGILPRMPPPPVDQLPLSVPVFQILLSLVDRDLHGYALIKDIEQRTDGEVKLTASTLYGALARLLEGALIEELDPDPGDERRRKYRLAKAGAALLRLEAARLERAADWARAKRLLPRHVRGERHAPIPAMARRRAPDPPARISRSVRRELVAAAGALAEDAREAGGRRRQWPYVVRELVAFAGLAIALAIRSTYPRRAWLGLCATRAGARCLRWPSPSRSAASIAAATTAFGLATAVLWRALPFDDASRLVFVWEESERDGVPQPSRVTGARYAAWRDQGDVFSSLALFGAAGFTLDSPAGAVSVRGMRVSANYFETLGIAPGAGPWVPVRRSSGTAAIGSSSCRRRSGSNATAGAATSSARS